MEEMLGLADAMTVKLSALATGSPVVATVIVPEVAPLGTLTLSDKDVAASTVAAVPLNLTVFEAGVEEKPVPLISTVAPTSPFGGSS
jgi:hypothetical protein